MFNGESEASKSLLIVIVSWIAAWLRAQDSKTPKRRPENKIVTMQVQVKGGENKIGSRGSP